MVRTEHFKTIVRHLGSPTVWRAKGWRPQCHPTTGDHSELPLVLTACAVNYIHGKNIRFAAPTMSRGLDLWAYANGVTLDFSRLGKPTDNAFIGAFKGRFRAECLNAYALAAVYDNVGPK